MLGAFYADDSSMARALHDYAPALEATGIPIGPLLGCGNQGCVYESGKHVVKLGFVDDEVKLSNLLLTLGEEHPAIVRTIQAVTLPHRDPPLRGRIPGLSVLVRERLRFDAERGDRVLGLLELAELIYNASSATALVAWVAKGGKSGTLTAAKVVERVLREYGASGLSEDESPPTPADLRNAADILDALIWLRKHGIVLGDLWAAGFGRGFGTKPENIGWRGEQVVIADLGVWKPL
jgi:hypothetical protein